MSIECVFFDCDGTLVDSEVLCTQAYVNVLSRYGIQCDQHTMFTRFKGVKLYDILKKVSEESGIELPLKDVESEYRSETTKLFDQGLKPISGAKNVVESVSVSKCVVSNGTIAKMEHSLGLTGMLEFFHDKLISGYDINRWKPDPTILIYAASRMGYSADKCILVDDSEAGVRAAISAGIPVFYYCADAHNPIID